MTHYRDTLAPDRDRGWEQAFSDMVYWKIEGVLTDAHVRSHVGFMERVLELKPRNAVLDLGCGLGQHCIELARRDYRVTGLDWSSAFLAAARERVKEAGVAVRLIQGDMSQLGIAGEFDAMILWGNTFGMLADEDNRHTLEGIRRALKPGGRALIDTQNYTSLGGEMKQGWGFGGFDEDDPNLLILTEDTRDVLRARFGFNALAIDLATGRRHCMPFSWRLYLLPELMHLLADVGLKLLGIYGDDPEKVDWKSYREDDPLPYSVEGYTEKAAKRIVLCSVA
jgi:SAM-dependent methyltransferase